jgi:hypothetical protein
MASVAKWAAGAAAVAMALGAGGAALANDSTAELAAGGLVLTKTTAIVMQSEDLFISDKEVKVHYVFANKTNADVTVTVAFPMPDITVEGMDDNISIPTQDPVNFLGFSTVADGKPVVAQVEQKVIKNGVDRTQLMRSLNVPLAPQAEATDKALDQLSAANQAQLIKLGLAMQDQYDDGDGRGMVNHLQATWTLKTTYYWRQTFPAGRTLVIDHHYTPAVGSSAGTSWGSADFAKQPDYQQQVAHYCVDDSFLAAVKRTIQPDVGFSNMQEERIEYILTSGANWAEPIGDFHMVIDKGDPTRLVSFCGTNVQKISPTQFEVHYTNFVPKQNVSVLILIHPSAQ